MRLIAVLVALTFCLPAFSQDKMATELEKLQSSAVTARAAAAANPTVKNAKSPPVLAYLIEQKRRRLNSILNLQKRIAQFQRDKDKEELLQILAAQVADLERRPLDPVSFDSTYDYPCATGLVGYSKKVRFVENTKDGKSVVLIDPTNTLLVMEGLSTSEFQSGKFFSIEKAILVGPQVSDLLFRGSSKKTFTATLVDLESLLQATPPKTP